MLHQPLVTIVVWPDPVQWHCGSVSGLAVHNLSEPAVEYAAATNAVSFYEKHIPPVAAVLRLQCCL